VRRAAPVSGPSVLQLAANDVPIFGLSYVSDDGGATWIRPAFNFRFSLVLAEPPK